VRRALLIVLVVAVAGVILLARTVDSPFGGDERGTSDAPAEAEAERGERADRETRAVRCPSGVQECREAEGRIIFVERVDPDGDGDLHVVLAGGGITGPGVTSVDVRPGLRPRQDPGIGDYASAAGLVQRGSIGQSQLHALRFRVHR
jgi:hypothetical protein